MVGDRELSAKLHEMEDCLRYFEGETAFKFQQILCEVLPLLAGAALLLLSEQILLAGITLGLEWRLSSSLDTQVKIDVLSRLVSLCLFRGNTEAADVHSVRLLKLSESN
ncbi:hypothetical protein BH11CYA1_BH11CYA1_47320 [soil metagenome]